MTIKVYSIKTNAQPSVTFLDDAGVAADPDTVELRVLPPDGAEQTYLYSASPAEVIVKDATGVYHADIYLDQPGEWFYFWEATGVGALTKSVAGQLVVEATQF